MSNTTDDEQLAQIKDWWQRNGKPLLTGGALALAIVFGWQAWQNHQANQAFGASTVYQQLLEVALVPASEVDAGALAELTNKLKSDYAGSAYAQYGALLLAKVAVEQNRFDEAATELKAVLDKPYDDVLGELARQRLARVLAAQDKAEEGLALLNEGKVVNQFAASREEVKGDLLVSLGRIDEARDAYSKAKAAMGDEAAQGTVEMKLNDLAKGDA